MPLYFLSSQGRPVKIVSAGDGGSLIVNRDIVNSVLYGDQSIASQNYSSYSVIDPLGSVTVDGQSDIYAIPLAGTPTVDVMQGAGDFAPSPALVALQISTLGLAKDATVTGVAKDTSINSVNTTLALGTNPNLTAINSTLGTPAQRADVQGLTIGGSPGGIPLLRDTNNLANATNQSLPANQSTVLFSNSVLTQPSFEAVFQLNAPTGAGAIPFAVLKLSWTDGNTGLTVGQKAFVLTAGNGAANALQYYISGPCRGNLLTASIANRDPAQVMTLTYSINMTSHVYLVDRLLQPLYAGTAPFGFQNPAGNPSKGLLFASQPSIPGSASTDRLCAASNAKCILSIDNGGAANGCAVLIQTPTGTPLYDESGAGQTIDGLVAAAGLRAFGEIQMPNGPVNVHMINQAATNTITPSVTITVMEY